jgi:hypothetical protein
MIKVWNATFGILRINTKNVILKPAHEASVVSDDVTKAHIEAGRLVIIAIPTIIENEETSKKSPKKKQESIISEEISEEVIESQPEVSESEDVSTESSILPEDNA